MKIEDMRRQIAPQTYEYLLILENKQMWLQILKLSKRKEAVITKPAISLRLSNMFNESKSSQFKTVLECISKPAEGKCNKRNTFYDFNSVLHAMGKRYLNRKGRL